MEKHPVVTQCKHCFKLEDEHGKWVKIQSINFVLPFQFHSTCPECKKKEGFYVDSSVLSGKDGDSSRRVELPRFH